MVFKTFERIAFAILLSAMLATFVATFYFLGIGAATAGKWFASTGLLATAAGVFQLEVSGLFQKIMDFYADEERLPYGPPSHITRQLCDDADHPVRSRIRDALFFNVSTGFWLIVAGTLIQVVAIWL
jgi:hypothetical protein